MAKVGQFLISKAISLLLKRLRLPSLGTSKN